MSDLLTLRPVEDSDIPQLTIWLNKEYILKWYHDAGEWLHEIRERNGSFSFLNHFMILKGSTPVGFGQYYDCFDAQEEWYSIDRPHAVFSIDYLIGEEEHLGKGYGKEIVSMLIKEIYRLSPNAEIIVQPDNENITSCKVLLANGLIYDEDKGYFLLKKNI
ncbi:MAG: GNAT family N-acetyltransferase [Bacteroidales bacterium]|jgi:RimJ/RimL family protein N-acetyltransferase|nr:GNAT family N-acetyltransferase [Bacteroidales bacterium]